MNKHYYIVYRDTQGLKQTKITVGINKGKKEAEKLFKQQNKGLIPLEINIKFNERIECK